MSEADAHIQDSQILQMSRQETNDAGHIRFLATLPSGREINSEWLDPGKRREAMKAWLGAVRAEIVADETETRLKAKRALSSEFPDSVPPAEQVSSAPIRKAAPSTPAAPSSPSASSVMSDPSLFIRQAVEAAEKSLLYWNAEAAKAIGNRIAAESDLKKWRAIALSIGVSTGHEEVSSSSAADESADSLQPGSSYGVTAAD